MFPLFGSSDAGPAGQSIGMGHTQPTNTRIYVDIMNGIQTVAKHGINNTLGMVNIYCGSKQVVVSHLFGHRFCVLGLYQIGI